MNVIPILQGGLGNNLFQICTAIAYGLKHNCYYAISTEIENPHYKGQKVFDSELLGYCSDLSIIGETHTYLEPYFHYKEIPKFDVNVLLLRGYFQSYKFFSDYRDEIIRLLDIPYDYKEGYVFIHQRLGDYKILGRFHQIITPEYIYMAIYYFTLRGYNKFLVFSDEIDEAKKVINSEKYPDAVFEYSEGKTEIEDLSLMANCQHGIMSASAYSWWGAWLGKNTNREIIYPLNWFGAELSHHSIKDLCPSAWTGI